MMRPALPISLPYADALPGGHGGESGTRPCRELVVIDPGVSSPEHLQAGLRPGLKALVLSADEPAPAQIARAVAGRALDAVHVIAHGQPAAVAFSGGLLDAHTLAHHQKELAAIGRALGTSGELLLWCCRSASGAVGAAFVDALAHATGAPVAASRSLVGAVSMGGSWRLDRHNGYGSGTAAPFTPEAIASYVGVLNIYEEQTGTDNPFSDFADSSPYKTPTFADIDGDGDLDVVVGIFSGSFRYLENTGSSTSPSYVEGSNPFRAPRKITRILDPAKI